MGQHASDDVGPGTARRHGRRSQHGLYLDHDLLDTAIDTAARSGRGQPGLQCSGEHPARRGALAMGVSWAMLSSWGVSTAEYVLYTLVSGIWNVFARLGLPVLALMILATAACRGRPNRRRGGRPDPAHRHGSRARPPHAERVVRAPRGPRAAGRARHGLSGGTPAGVLRRPWITARLPRPGRRPDRRARLVDHRHHGRSNLALWLVLLACLGGVGLSQAAMPSQASLAASHHCGS